MSDALLKEISTKLDNIAGLLSKGGVSAGAVSSKTNTPAANPNKIAGDTAMTPAQKKEAADKAIAAAKAKKEAEGKGASGPAAGTKAKGGKHTIEQVREIIRKVANDVDKQSAKDILKDDGGVEKVVDLKPELYDAVYEACEVVLKGEGGKSAAPAEEEDEFG